MLDPKFVLENIQFVRERIASRGIEIPWEELVQLSQKRKFILREVEALRSRQNKASEVIGRMRKEGKNPGTLILEMKEVAGKLKDLEDELRKNEGELRQILLGIPNIPHSSVPYGKGSEDNLVVREFGKKPEFNFDPKPHWEIGKNLGILDFDRASKIAGSRFAVYLGGGALLERALINFMLDIHTRERGYKEMIPPFIANEESLIGTGNLPKFEDDLFKLKGYSWYLIPTAEVPLTNYYRNEILSSDSLPLRFVAYTPCFRREAGSYGKDIKGLIRQHQFNKVELMTFSLPEKSYEELERMTNDAEEVLKRLDLHYRVVSLCTADLGFSGAKTYDLEVWMPFQKKYLEVSSCTNCEDFQARRANIRFRREAKSRLEFVHTLNGSGVALGRTVSAILESYQEEEGSVRIPEALRPYTGGLEKITES